MSQLTHDTAFPSIMHEKLRSVRWRQAGISALRALAIFAAVLLTTMIVAMLIDWCFTVFDTRIRILLTSSSLSLSILAMAVTGIRPVINAFGWTRAAGSVDQRIPLMEERWQTVASFAESGRRTINGTAAAMLAQVTSEAIAMSTLVNPGQVVRRSSLRQPAMAAGLSSLALAGFMLIDWQQTSVLMQRFWSPTSNISATQLSGVTGDTVIPRGQSIDIDVTMNGLQRNSAIMTMIPEMGMDANAQRELSPVADHPGILRATVDVYESFRYRIQAGDGRTEWHTVTAIDYPALAEVRLTVTPPKYVNEPATEKTLIPGRLRTIQGSQLELSLKPEQQLESLTLILTLPPQRAGAVADASGQINDEQPIQKSLVLKRADDGWYHFETQLTHDFTLSPRLLSAHGLMNQTPRVCRIEVIEDRPPVARIISPNQEFAVAPDDTIEIRFEAHDDYGIATAELVIYDTDTKPGEEQKVLAVKQIPLGDQQLQKHIMGSTELNLKELGLEEGQNISYAVRVTDNRMLEIQSDELAINNVAGEPESDENLIADTGNRRPALSDTPTVASPAMADNENRAGADPAARENRDHNNESHPQNASAPNFQKNEATTAEATTAEATTAEATSAEATSAEATSAEATSAEATSTEATSTEATSAEATSAEATSAEATSTEATSTEATSTEATSTEATSTEADAAEATSTEATSTEATSTEATSAEATSTEATSNEATSTEATSTEATSTEATSTEATSTEATSNEATSTEATSNEATSTEADAADPHSAETDAAAPDATTKGGVQAGNSASASEELNNANDEVMPEVDANREIVERSEPPSKIALTAQRSDDGQRRETDQRRLKIRAGLDAIAERSEDQRPVDNSVRKKVVQIDEMLETIETKLEALYRHQIADELRADGFRELDLRLGDVEMFVAELNQETTDSAFEFVGLQMVDISSTHVTPARDANFSAIRRPDSGADVYAEEALHHVVSARELLLALLKKYDRVAQEQELAAKLDEAIRMYTVYVEGTQQLLREAQQNFDPLKLQREMAVIEVDQAYLDRLAEVTRMRRDMMSELARILGDDPRLRSRYLDLIKRRRASLRSQLAELAERQDQAAQEVTGWLAVAENQRDNYWLQVTDLRLDLPKELAKDAQLLVDRIEKQLPLVLNPSNGTPAMLIQLAKQISLDIRRCDFEVREIRKATVTPAKSSNLRDTADKLVFRIGELAAALDRLSFEGQNQDGVADYVPLRLVETRALADQADIWAETAAAIEQHKFHPLAVLDQRQILIATELLRTQVQNIEADLAPEFNEENPMPPEISELAQQLNWIMESITFNQSAATFAFSDERLETGAVQQEKALVGFEQAGKIMDQLRRKTIETLDRIDVPNPDINQLQDPTLDQFLANLEREPDIEALLGIPNRPRNIRVLQDAMQWAQNGSNLLGTSGEAAMNRIQQQVQQRLKADGEGERQPVPKEAREMSEIERQQLAESRDMQQMLKDQMQQTMRRLEERAKDESQSAEQRRRMKEMAQQMNKALEEMQDTSNPEQLWRRMVEADQAKAALEALAKGENLPDDQWNKLMSTLDNGIGQVGGRTPPEDYRRAIEQYQDRIRELTGNAGGD